MRDPAPLLSRIADPGDLKNLSPLELNRLAAEIRETIVSTVSRNGGHLSSNLGVVELTIALHRVFNTPEDKIVWDVGHQCYAHKLLTGRYGAFSTLRKAGGLAGFPKIEESPHDCFNTGHASTSISAALGLLAGDQLRGGTARAVAVIGDGALTGGLAYEALSHAGQLGLPLVVILNDNKMSISPNVGGLSKYLSRLSMKAKYQSFRRKFDSVAKKLPCIGNVFFDLVIRLKRAVKAVFYTDNFFVDLGFEYVGPIEGHQIQRLVDVFRDVRRLDRPVVIHVITRKGKGYGFAEDDPGNYHGVGSFCMAGGLSTDRRPPPARGLRPFTDAFSRAMLQAAQRDGRVVGITAAMEKGTGLATFHKAFPRRFFDVGIAEAHAVTFAAGLARQGLKPVAAIYSTFIQRATDQVIHDVGLQGLPVIFALDRAGFVGEDGETHQGLFDISLFRPVPGMTILTPAGENELSLMLDWALNRTAEPAGDPGPGPAPDPKPAPGPVMIRYPKTAYPADIPAFAESLEPGRGVWIRQGREKAPVCIAFTGSLYPEALDAAALLEGRGIGADLYHLRFLKPVDEDYLAALMDRYELTVFVEEGIREGGFGEYAAELARRRNCAGLVRVLAAEGGFTALGTRRELLHMNGLDGEGIAAGVLAFLPEEGVGSREVRQWIAAEPK
ncbi:MAG: 1-deoxy-D-xylulose-5-phosphate synthase [Treponema sp.]|jgi:1-deoxy-D-xylulose-5-phosphate synthase|nr:1-deoxy-D-xylulose-5-phosphate synthase [Treponema sp.]